MAEAKSVFTREQQRAKLISALSDLTDLYNEDFGDGSDVHEDGVSLQLAIDAIDDVLAAMDGPDEDQDEDQEEDEENEEDKEEGDEAE